MKTGKILALLLMTVQTHYAATANTNDYRSPLSIISSDLNKKIYIAEVTSKKITILNAKTKKIENHFKLENEPMGLALSPDNTMIYISCGVSQGIIQQIDVKTGQIITEIEVGHSPIGPQVSPDGKMLYVCNRFDNNVSVVDLQKNIEIATIPVKREPIASTLSLDGKHLFIANHLPVGAANVDHMTSVIDVMDTQTHKIIKSIALPNGAIDLRSMCLSHDGLQLYVPSILARFLVPTTQIERGWINTHALNIIDVKKQKLLHTVLLDDVDLGAANPWGIVCTADGQYIAVVHSATNEVSIINRDKLLKKLAASTALAKSNSQDEYNMSNNPANDLSFLSGIRQRIKLPGIGPRGITEFGKELYITQYFTGDLAIVTPGIKTQVETLALGDLIPMDKVRKGEMFFNDATLCFQQWQACSTCHPDVRSDAVNWDLLNDGIGNPKSTKSLLNAHFTAPVMITGIRDNAETAVRAGIKYIQFSVVDEEKATSIDEFLKSVKPVPSPSLVNGSLSPMARRGAKIFMNAECIQCHSGPYYSNGSLVDVGTTDGLDKGVPLNVPHLTEVWRTAPYLNDGRAAELKDIFTKFNTTNMHGDTKDLSDAELDDLIEFVKSL